MKKLRVGWWCPRCSRQLGIGVIPKKSDQCFCMNTLNHNKKFSMAKQRQNEWLPVFVEVPIK